MKCVFQFSQDQWTDSAIDTLMSYLDCDNMYLQACFCTRERERERDACIYKCLV